MGEEAGLATLQGRLLVAAPALIDPNFFRTVVLVCRHDDDGALGVVLNRPSETAVSLFLPAWEQHLTSPDVVFVGGPVQPETAVAIARLRSPAPAEGWMAIDDQLGLLDLARPAEDVELGGLRVFSGYAGWSGGQLEGEIAAHDWFVVARADEDPLTAHPEELWRRVLRRQPGPLAFLATFPLDPSLN